MGTLSMWFIPVFMLLSSCLLHEILCPPDPLVRSISKQRKRVRLDSGRCMWAPSSLRHVAEGGDYAAGGLGRSADKHFKFYVLNVYLKNYWFSIYGGNTKFPFKIIFPFLNWNIHIPKSHAFQVCNSVVSSMFTMLCNRHQYSFPELFHHPEQKLCPHKTITPIPPCPSAW